MFCRLNFSAFRENKVHVLNENYFMLFCPTFSSRAKDSHDSFHDSFHESHESTRFHGRMNAATGMKGCFHERVKAQGVMNSAIHESVNSATAM